MTGQISSFLKCHWEKKKKNGVRHGCCAPLFFSLRGSSSNGLRYITTRNRKKQKKTCAASTYHKIPSYVYTKKKKHIGTCCRHHLGVNCTREGQRTVIFCFFSIITATSLGTGISLGTHVAIGTRRQMCRTIIVIIAAF